MDQNSSEAAQKKSQRPDKKACALAQRLLILNENQGQKAPNLSSISLKPTLNVRLIAPNQMNTAGTPQRFPLNLTWLPEDRQSQCPSR